MIQGEKQLLRNKILRELRSMEPAWRVEASARIRDLLHGLEVWQSARVVYGFAPMRIEPDWIGAGLPGGKTFAFPRVAGKSAAYFLADGVEELGRGAFGVREPQGSRLAPAPDLILVPGLAFDRVGGRLGRGGGYFDRILSGVTCCRLAVCFSFQMVSSVPTGLGDEWVDGILTEEGLMASGRGRRWFGSEAGTRGEDLPGGSA